MKIKPMKNILKFLKQKHLLPLILFCGLGVAVFLPIFSNFDHNIFGHMLATPGNFIAKSTVFDGYQHIWNFWWAKKSCLGMCGDFWHTNYLFYPTGTSLHFHNFAFPAIVLLLPFLMLGLSAISAYNLTLIIAIISSAFFAYLLVYYLTNNRKASIIAGLFYGICPYLVGHMIDGQIDHASIQLFPLFLLLLFKSQDKKTYIYPVLAGLTLFVLGTDFTFLILGLLLFGLFVVYEATRNRSLKTLFIKSALTLATFSIPFLIFFNQNLLQIDSFQLRGETKWTSEFFSTDLFSYIISPQTSLVGNQFFKNTRDNFVGINSDQNMYLGIIALVLAGLAIFTDKQKKLCFWSILLGFSSVMTLGPKLHIGGKVVFDYMPYAIWDRLPILNILRTPSRFGVLIYLALAVLLAFGYIYLEKRFARYSLPIFLFVFLAIFIDFFPAKIPVSTQYLPAAYAAIVEDKSDFAILEYPLLWATGLNTMGNFPPAYMYYQTEHEKPIAGGYLTRIENNTFESYKDDPLLKYFYVQGNLISLPSDIIDIFERYKPTDLTQILGDRRYKYLIFNNRYQSAVFEKVRETLGPSLEQIFSNEESTLYKFK
jgi:hypothetical protein